MNGRWKLEKIRFKKKPKRVEETGIKLNEGILDYALLIYGSLSGR